MLKFDENQLKRRLEPFDRSQKTAFAAACAQRLVPLFDRYTQQEGDPSCMERMNIIVSAAWQAASGMEIEAIRLGDEAESMVPDEDEGGWTPAKAYAGNAAAAAAYALRVWITDDAQHAVWAALQLFDAADFAYFQANPDGGSFSAEENQASLNSQIVQSVIAAIQRDLDSIEEAKPWSEVRQRAEIEGKVLVEELARSR